MKLKHFGAAGTVTGSCHRLTSKSGKNYLIDFGMFQGSSEINALNHKPLDFNPQEISHVFLTHAHLDHCGRLPMLINGGFEGNVYCTEPTRDLVEIVLYDSAKIAQLDEELEALYTEVEVEKILSRIKIIDYDTEFQVDGLMIKYRDAGHLLGSSFIEITEGNERIIFSGDLGNLPPTLLSTTSKPNDSVYVVMESTYGDRNHPKENPIDIIKNEINLIENKRSVLLIPAFSLERTQGLLYMIKMLKRENKIGVNTPVFLDSPMAISATEVYKEHKKYFNEELKHEFAQGDAFDFPGLRVSRKGGGGKIDRIFGSKIIIAGSGMMNGGRIVGHAAKYLPDPQNRLLIVGYQGEETLGREIVEGNRIVEIYGKRIEIKASVTQINSLSAHADQSMLLDWLSQIKGVRSVVLIHGEDQGPRETLAKKVRDMGISNVYMPQLGDEINLQ